MKIQFDGKQAYQQEAVAAFTDLFEGQPLNQGDYSVTINAVNESAQNNLSLFALSAQSAITLPCTKTLFIKILLPFRKKTILSLLNVKSLIKTAWIFR